MRNNALKGVQLRAETAAMRMDRAPLASASRTSPEACLDFAALENFLDSEFDGRSGIAREFPLLVGDRNPGRSLVLRERAAIVSHAAWRPLQIRAGARRISAAGIGLVTTAAGWRGRGLAAQVVAACVEAAAGEGAELALLFGTPSPLYERAGFVLAGRERVLRVEPGTDAKEPGIRCGGPQDAARLLPLLEEHALRVSRGVEEFQIQLGIANTELYVLEQDERLAAYCVLGKGRDLGGVIHEWAGSPQALESLIRGVVSQRGGPLWVIGPAALAPPLEAPSGLGALAMFRILRPESFGSADPVELFGNAETPARLPLYVWGLDSI